MKVEPILAFRKKPGQKFPPISEVDIPTDPASHVIMCRSYLDDESIEDSFNYKQPIPYVLVVDSLKAESPKVLVYKRGGTEVRLDDLYSVGFGGHVNVESVNYLDSVVNFDFTFDDCIHTELSQELHHVDEDYRDQMWWIDNGNFLIVPTGLALNSEHDAVNKVHYGVVYFCEVGEHLTNLKLGDHGKALHVEDLHTVLDKYNFEEWSKLVLNNLPTFLENVNDR